MPLSNKRVLVPLALAIVASAGQAQEVSIGEYSAVQRQAIADEMAKARGKVGAAAPAASAPAAPVAIIARPRPALPTVRVAGVAVIRQKASAEVSVDGTAYMLEVGDRVPGTQQTVSHIGTDRVELSAPAGGRKRGKTETTIIKLHAK